MSVISFDAPMSVALIEALPKGHGDSSQFKSILTIEQTLFVWLSPLLNRMRLDEQFFLVPNHLRLFAIFDSASE